MKCNKNQVPMVRLGQLITQCSIVNDGGEYGFKDVRGMTITKQIIPTKANANDADLSKYLVVLPNEFVYNPRTHGKKIGLGMNQTGKPFLISWNNIAFKVIDKNKLCPDYLYMLLCRDEWDREACFRSWGSSTEVLSWGEFCLMQIPLPDIEVQKSVVAAYKGLKNLIETNEALIEPLQNACNAYVVDLKKKYPMKALGPYIQECDERNRDGKIKLSQGISNEKYFQEPKQVAENSQSDRIVRKGQFAYNRATTRNGEKISIALRKGPDCTVSSAYGVFKVIDEKVLMSEYLLLFFKRSEFDRYARYMSKGSAHEFFEMDEMQRVQIPLPPIEIQKAIVAVYKGLAEAKRIACEAKEELKKICPALVQMAARSA